ncbi:hypothetical protein C1646_751936 [Rhizophagus diaphanus]|nr:hypothetical protein C1646_751936 [Rhizophagus diaphanus] [Rhizophagus sp. MUCL 43196]
MNINQEVEVLQQEIANGPPLFPPPNTNAVELSEQNQTQQTYSRYVIDKVTGDLWRTTTRNNKLVYSNLCVQINSILNQ